MIFNVDFVLKLSNFTLQKRFKCIKCSLNKLFIIINFQFNHHTLPVTPFKRFCCVVIFQISINSIFTFKDFQIEGSSSFNLPRSSEDNLDNLVVDETCLDAESVGSKRPRSSRYKRHSQWIRFYLFQNYLFLKMESFFKHIEQV